MPKLNVAIVGAGPGGLATIIHFQRIPDVQLSVFDGAKELREVGAGISLNENTWRHLQLLGVADKIDQYTNRGDSTKVDVENRNGVTGKLISRRHQSSDPDKPARSRIERYKLQNALLSAVPRDLIQLNKKLITLKEEPQGVTLTFQDGSHAGPFDLVIGADGIRSAVRAYAFPEHKLSYTGKTAFRVLIPQSEVAHIPDIPQSSCFWHTSKTHVYTNPLDNGLFEIATRAIIPDEDGTKTSWGQEVSRDQVIHHYDGYCETIRKVIAAPKTWLEFAIFGGPRLETVVRDRIALLGDASHPLSGAFGSGAAFAFEDAFVLAQAVRHSLTNQEDVAQALRVYDEIRAPHYKALYAVLDGQPSLARQIDSADPKVDENELLNDIVVKGFGVNTQWIYKYDVTQVWRERLDGVDAQRSVLAA